MLDDSSPPNATLSFRESPDYEDPKDMNRDNLYELTLIATDSNGLESILEVTVRVINDPNDDTNMAGELEIFNRQPEVNTLLAVTADPEDDDGGVRSVKWQWYYQSATSDGTVGDVVVRPCPTSFTADDITAGDPDRVNTDTNTSTWVEIEGATSSNYMPTRDRIDVYDTTTPTPADRDTVASNSDCLMVRASYLDNGPRLRDESSTRNYDESRQYAYAISEFSVQAEDTDNVKPMFADGDVGLGGTQLRQRVNENFELDDDAVTVSPVGLTTATDSASTPGDLKMENVVPGTIRILDGTFPDDDKDGIIEETDGTYAPDDFTGPTAAADTHKLTFSIGGADAEHFDLVDKATGAIRFTESPNYEVMEERRYTFTLTATDPTNATDSITIILDVENLPEDPEFTGGERAVNYDENSTDTVETYTADDPEADKYFWGLTGTDAALFDIGIIDGRLTFKKAPNYEDPEDDGSGNVYDVDVHLLKDEETITDEDQNATPPARQWAVAITVMDVAEAPMFTKTIDDNDMVVPTMLYIDENKQPDMMLNRALANSPQASDEDDIPETGGDDMYSDVALEYTLSGPGAGAFQIVPATGELRTAQVLDYERLTDKSYEVTVTATDQTEKWDSIDLIINVNNVDEAPVAGGPNQAPEFPSMTMTRDVAEGTASGMAIGDPVMATDPENSGITYELGGADAGHFTIDAMTGQLMTSGALDHEATDSYTVMVTATDDDTMDPMSRMTTVTINVTDVNEGETLTLSPMAPSVGDTITATLNDNDEIVSRDSVQWSRSMTMSGTFTRISGATSMSYEVMAADEDYYLRATVEYTDTHGSQEPLMATTTAKVSTTPIDPNAALIARYDAVANGGNGNGTIEKSEAIAAINDYLFPQAGVDPISKAEVITLINLYLFPDS